MKTIVSLAFASVFFSLSAIASVQLITSGPQALAHAKAVFPIGTSNGTADQFPCSVQTLYGSSGNSMTITVTNQTNGGPIATTCKLDAFDSKLKELKVDNNLGYSNIFGSLDLVGNSMLNGCWFTRVSNSVSLVSTSANSSGVAYCDF